MLSVPPDAMQPSYITTQAPPPVQLRSSRVCAVGRRQRGLVLRATTHWQAPHSQSSVGMFHRRITWALLCRISVYLLRIRIILRRNRTWPARPHTTQAPQMTQWILVSQMCFDAVIGIGVLHLIACTQPDVTCACHTFRQICCFGTGHRYTIQSHPCPTGTTLTCLHQHHVACGWCVLE